MLEAADAGRTVLTPNTELAAALFDAVERAHRDAGRDVWPTPRVRDFGGWLKEQHVRRAARRLATPRCLSDVEERELWREAVLESESSEQFLEPSGAARAARRARRAVHEYGIPMERRRRARLRGIAGISGLERALRRALPGASTASVPIELLDRGTSSALGGAAEPLAWIESPALAAGRSALAASAKPAMPLQPSRSDAARRMPAVLEARLARRGARSDRRLGDRQSAGDAEFRAWICVPDLAARRAELVDAFDAALAPQRFALAASRPAGAPYAVAGGTPLADYAPVRARSDFLSRRARSGFLRADSARCCDRRSCRHRPAEAGAAALLDVQPCAARCARARRRSASGWRSRSASRAHVARPVAALRRLHDAPRCARRRCAAIIP